MRSFFRRKLAEVFRRLTAGLLHVQILDLRCISILGANAVNLPGRLLGSATRARISFKLRWPLLSANCPASVSLLLFEIPDALARRISPSPGLPAPPSPAQQQPAAAHGYEEGQTRAPCSAPRHSAIGYSSLLLQQRQIRTGPSTPVRIDLPGRIFAPHRRLRLEARDERNGKLLASLAVEVLDEPQVEALRLEELRAQDQHLWIQAGTHRFLCDVVVETSDFLVPELTLAGSVLHSVLPPCKLSLTLTLASEENEALLASQSVVVRQNATPVTWAPILISNPALFPCPGAYRLLVRSAEKELASFQFRIADRCEWLEQLRLSARLETQTPEGQFVHSVGSLHWGKHTAFRGSVKIETKIPAPNTRIRCVGRVLLGDTTLLSQEFLLCLAQNSQRVRLKSIGLSELQAHRRAGPFRLLLVFNLEGVQQTTLPVIILAEHRLTNFEGQLEEDAEALGASEEAYLEIMKGLDAADKCPSSIVSAMRVPSCRLRRRFRFWRFLGILNPRLGSGASAQRLRDGSDA